MEDVRCEMEDVRWTEDGKVDGWVGFRIIRDSNRDGYDRELPHG